MKPLIKWMGGKRKLLSHYKKLGWNPTGRVLEPFCGSAAISLDTENDFVLNDANGYLINFYKVISQFTESDIHKFIERFYSHTFSKEEFYEYRDKQYEITDPYELACWFFYINRIGFNGLWRVNSKGKVNMAYGDPLNSWQGLKDITLENFIQYANKLKNKRIHNIDGIQFMLNESNEGDWVFVDPPYDNAEDKYTSEGWSREKLVSLKKAMLEVKDKGCHVFHTNANTEFVRELFADCEIHEVGRQGGMNSDASKRSTVKELLIKI